MSNCVTLTKGRGLSCRSNASAGFKAIGLAPWEDGMFSPANGELAELPTDLTAIYRYELKNSGNTYVEEITTDDEARSIGYDGTLSVVLQKLDLETRNEVAELAKGELAIFIETNAGEILLIGYGFGALLTGGNANTGGAKTDFNGWNLTFTTSEAEPYITLSTAAKTAYATVVVGPEE